MDEGLTRSVYELFEIILPVALFLLIGGAIFFVSNPDFSRSYIFQKEMSYTSSLVSENTVVEINLKNTRYENVKVSSKNGNIAVNVDSNGVDIGSGGETKYFGNNVKIEQKSENEILISK